MSPRKYIPALSLKWLTPFYDRLMEGPISETRMRKDMLARMGDLNGRKILDVGCGTGTLAMLLKKAHPGAEVVGLDGDAQILGIARSKARSHGLDIQFDEGMSFELPYPDGSFDVVVTTLMLHHLDRDAKTRTAVEMNRVLRSGGWMYGLDFAEPRGPIGRAIRPALRHLERVGDNLDGYLPVMFAEAGFAGYREASRFVLGSIALFQASKR
jgi:ubiquinone/menaquinone biosynthesis C-methylase UbiE